METQARRALSAADAAATLTVTAGRTLWTQLVLVIASDYRISRRAASTAAGSARTLALRTHDGAVMPARRAYHRVVWTAPVRHGGDFRLLSRRQFFLLLRGRPLDFPLLETRQWPRRALLPPVIELRRLEQPRRPRTRRKAQVDLEAAPVDSGGR
jgi:hypothetical protein